MSLKKILIYILLLSGVGSGILINCLPDSSSTDSNNTDSNNTTAGLGGTWLSECVSDFYATGDINYGYVFSGSTVQVINNTYSSTDLSCTGTTSTISNTYTFTEGSTVTAFHLGSNQNVTATELDVIYSYAPLYTLYWIDTSVTPNKLYLGTPANVYTDSGISSATRHTRISSLAYTRQ